MDKIRILLACLFWLGITLIQLNDCLFAQENKIKNILILTSYHHGFQWDDNVVEGIKSGLKPTGNIEFHIERMDTKRIYAPEHLKNLVNLYQYKFKNIEFDLIITSDDNAFNFIRKYRNLLFPRAPVVFLGVNNFKDEDIQGLDWITGMAETMDIKGTIDTALKLHPKTNTVYVINDYTTTGITIKKSIIELLKDWRDHPKIVFSKDTSMDDLLINIDQLPKNTLIYLGAFFRDKEGQFFNSEEITRLIVKHSPAPVYTSIELFFSNGVVGGNLIEGYVEGKKIALIGKQIIDGISPNHVPVFKTDEVKSVYDYNALIKWKIDVNLLPLNSFIRNKPPSFYGNNKPLVWIVTSVIAVLLAFILGLLINILKRKKSEKELQKNEERYRSLIETQTDLVCRVSSDGTFLFVNEVYAKFFNKPKEELVGSKWQPLPVDDDVHLIESVLSKLTPNNPTITIENRVFSGEGEIHWMQFINKGIFDRDGNLMEIQSIGRDITDRKQSEKALQESEDKFKNIFELSPVMMALSDIETGLYLDVNDTFLRQLGFSREEVVGTKSTDLCIFFDPSVREDLIRMIKDQGFVLDHEIQLRRKSGSIFHCIFSTHVVTLQEKKLLLTTAADITKRKEIEEELLIAKEKAEESNQRYLNLMDSLGTGVVLHAPDTSIVLSNPMASEILGISPEQMKGKKAIDPRWRFVRNDGTDMPLEEYPVNKALSLMKSFSEYFIGIKRPDRKYITWVNVNASLVFDKNNNIKYVTISFNDTTEQKQAEQELKENEEKLNALFTSLTEMVVMHELVLNAAGEAIDYRIIDCNKVFTEVTGIRKEDAIGKLATEVYQTDPPPYLEKYAKVGLGGDPHEFNIFYPPLDKHFMISVVSPQAGKFATITTDISDMMQIQEMIIAKNKEMENYLYVASHDLRTPLVNIQGFSQRLKKQADSIKTLFADKTLEPEILHQLGNITDEDIPKTLGFILGNIEKMDTLINGLLQLSRTGRVEMNIQEIDMNALFAKILQSLDFQIKEAQCEIHIDPLPECFGDAALLDQLFSNIISNALKHSDSQRALEITVDAKKIHNRVVYAIRDTGKGIAQKHLDKIWDVFYRIDPRSGKTGEGIGLSLVKRIAEKHKGKVWAESEENKGSVFHIELHNRSFTES
jgi:PAS domain S-box-containing protein